MKSKRIPIKSCVVGLCAWGLAITALAAENPRTFLQEAIQGDRFEISTAKLALQKSTDPNVTALAQRLSTDHSALLKNAQSLATRERVPKPHSLSSEQSKELAALRALAGNQFDRAYVSL